MMLGIDPFIGDEGNYAVSDALISVLNRKNIKQLAQVRRPNWFEEDSSYWLSFGELELKGVQVVEWDNYVSCLNRASVVLSNEEYMIVSEIKSSTHTFLTKLAYEIISSEAGILSLSQMVDYFGNGKFLRR